MASRSNLNLEVLVYEGHGGNPEINPRSKARTNNKVNPRDTARTEIEPESQRWEASAYPLRHPCSPSVALEERRISGLCYHQGGLAAIPVATDNLSPQQCSAGKRGSRPMTDIYSSLVP